MCNAKRMESRKQISGLKNNKREMNDQNEKKGGEGGKLENGMHKGLHQVDFQRVNLAI